MAENSASRRGIDCLGLSKSYHVGKHMLEAICDINLFAAAGEVTCILGPSGCGKSTLLRLIGGLEKADSGTISHFCGTVQEALDGRDIGFVFQTPALLAWRNVIDNVRLPVALGAGAGRTPEQALERVGLSEYASLFPAQLSGGMQQRAAIARALTTQPRLLLMDEPFAALDEVTREGLQNLVRSIAINEGTAVIFVTHNISEAVFIADQIIVLSTRPGTVKGQLGVAREGISDAEFRFSAAAAEIGGRIRQLSQ